MKKTKTYYYEVITPFEVWNFKVKIGDLMTNNDLISLPPCYRKHVKLLDSPVTKIIS